MYYKSLNVTYSLSTDTWIYIYLIVANKHISFYLAALNNKINTLYLHYCIQYAILFRKKVSLFVIKSKPFKIPLVLRKQEKCSNCRLYRIMIGHDKMSSFYDILFPWWCPPPQFHSLRFSVKNYFIFCQILLLCITPSHNQLETEKTKLITGLLHQNLVLLKCIFSSEKLPDWSDRLFK